MKRGRKREFSHVRMIQLALQGLKHREIAEKMGCTLGTVSRGLKHLYISGWPERKDRPTGINVHIRRKVVTPVILMLHDQGRNMKEISEIVGSSKTTVSSILKEHDCGISQGRGRAIAVFRRHCEDADRLADYLEAYGPQHLKALRLGRHLYHHIASDDRFRFLKFSIGLGRFGVNRPVRKLARKRCSVPINALAATGDPRIPGWLAAQVPWRLEGTGEAAAMMRRLRDRIGREHAAITIEMLGYQYMASPVSGTYTNTQWRDMLRTLVVEDDGEGCMHRAWRVDE
jgi:hypothetical protein